MRIPERQAELDALTRKYLSDPEPEPNGRNHRTAGTPPDRTDEEVIELCRKAKNAAKFSDLYDAGDTTLYEGDESRADLALASMLAFYTQDSVQLERLLDGSALGQRQKWRNRPDYRRRTVEKALGELRETYTPPRRSFSAAGPGGGQGAEADLSAIPKIQVNNRHLREVTSDALKALELANTPPEVFVRAGALVRVREDEHGTPQIQPMELNHVRGRLARVANFVRITESGETKVNPPEVVVKDLMALSSWPFPALEAVVESPILRPDGSIFDTPGYDRRTRLYYRPVPGFECPEIPAEPTKEDVQRSLELVNEAVGEFPYADESSAANTLALLVTQLIRHAIQGPVPLGLLDAPQAGTGKTLLAEIIALIGTGRAGEMLGAPRDDEEWRKQITSKLAAGGTMIIVDNVEGSLYAPSLARALTSRTWTDRVLGRSEMVTVSQQATWIATGNNIILRGDLPRRCYWIRLDAKQSRPWKREDFKHPDLNAWVEKKRGELVGAVLTVARAWYAAGKPKAEGIPRLGSFECWTEIVGGILAFAGIKSFLSNLEELYSKADEGNAEWEAFLEEWWRQRGEDPITVKDLTKLINDESSLKDALPGDLSEALDKGEGSFTRRLGNALSKRAGTRYGEEGLHIAEAGEFRRAKRWSVQESSGECEFVSFVSLYNPSASKIYAYNTEDTENIGVGESETNSTNSQTHTEDHQGSQPAEDRKTDETAGGATPVSFDLEAGESATVEELRDRRRLTEDEARQVQKLVSEGMSPALARAEVISEKAAPRTPEDREPEGLGARLRRIRDERRALQGGGDS